MSRFSRYQVSPDVVRRAQEGDPDAYEIIYRTFSTPVYTLARRMISQPALAEEALQETFLSVLTGIAGFQSDAPLWSWVRQIAVNECLMTLRSAWHRKAQTLDEGMDVLPETAGSAAVPGPDIDLEEALRRLPDTARAVVWLHDIEGYTHKEIAVLMNRSESFSKSQLARAYRRLKAGLVEPDEVKACMPMSSNY